MLALFLCLLVPPGFGSDFGPRTLVHVPAGLAEGERAPLLVFLHGGGGSTATEEGAREKALHYLEGLRPYAESRKVALLLPMTVVGWSGSWAEEARALLSRAAAELPVDPKRAVLAGHSMGGMGVTRMWPFLTDVFAGALVLSAGTQPEMLSRELLLAYFGGKPLVHVNEDEGRWKKLFGERMARMTEALARLAGELGREPDFEYRTRPGGHDLDYPLVYEELDRLFARIAK